MLTTSTTAPWAGRSAATRSPASTSAAERRRRRHRVHPAPADVVRADQHRHVVRTGRVRGAGLRRERVGPGPGHGVVVRPCRGSPGWPRAAAGSGSRTRSPSPVDQELRWQAASARQEPKPARDRVAERRHRRRARSTAGGGWSAGGPAGRRPRRPGQPWRPPPPRPRSTCAEVACARWYVAVRPGLGPGVRRYAGSMDLVPTAVSPQAIDAVYERLRPYVRDTPVVSVDRADFGLSPGPLVLKLEFLQHSGSFKARGAFANLLLRDVPPAGVVAASGGNHGRGGAYAARALGVPAHVFVPTASSPAKIARIRGYGAELVVDGDSYDDALAASERFRRHLQRAAAARLRRDRDDARHRHDRRRGRPSAARADHAARRRRRRWAARRPRRPLRRPGHGRRADRRARPRCAPRCTPARRSTPRSAASRWTRWRPCRSASNIPGDAPACRAGAAGRRRRDPRRATPALGDAADRGGAGRRTALAALLSGPYQPGPDEVPVVVISGANTNAVTF